MTPGWVDLHTHVYWGVAPLGVEADAHRLRRGVTTAVDAGSSRASTFAGFKRYVIDVSASRVVAMLHLSEIGVMRDDTFGDYAIGELEDLSTLTSVTAPVASPGPLRALAWSRVWRRTP